MSSAMKTALASMVLLAASTSVVYAAGAGSGVVKFEGEIIEAACSITPGTSDQLVKFGQVATSQLKSGGMSLPQKIEIELEGCSLDDLTDQTVTATFTGTESVDVPKALGITGTAKGAGIVIVDDLGAAIELGKASAPRMIGAGKNTLLFGAYMKGMAAGDLTHGEFTAITNFALAYQ